MIETTGYPLTEQARETAGMARTIYLLVVCGDEVFPPVGQQPGAVSVITARRAHPRVPIYTAAAAAARKHLGYETPEPVFIGVIPDGEHRFAAVFWVKAREQP